MFPFEWVRQEQWRQVTARVISLELDPEIVCPAVSVQTAWNRCQGIVRGYKVNGILSEDHIREVLDDSGNLVDIAKTGQFVFGPEEIRAQVWQAHEHLDVYQRTHPDEFVIGWTGNGNLLSNPYFVAFDGTSSPPTLFHLASEAPYLVRTGRSYSCLVVRKPEFRPRVTIERVFFENSRPIPQIYSAQERPITNEVEYATFGQQLIEQGRPVDDEDVIRMARRGEFYDLRHLFLFGRVDTGQSRWLDVGLASFWDEEGRMDADVVEAAIRGESMAVDVRQFSPEQVDEAMWAKGYDKVPHPNGSGQYSLQGGLLQVVFRRGIYPHNMVGIRKDGSMIVVALKGLSNRIGVTIHGAAEIMKILGAENALMIANGGDAVVSSADGPILPSFEGSQSRQRSVVLFRTPRMPERPHSVCWRFVEHPEQHAPAC